MAEKEKENDLPKLSFTQKILAKRMIKKVKKQNNKVKKEIEKNTNKGKQVNTKKLNKEKQRLQAVMITLMQIFDITKTENTEELLTTIDLKTMTLQELIEITEETLEELQKCT